MTDILVIGGGASGLLAACQAAGEGKSVAVLEASARVGRKILASGNGRCNLMNDGEPVYFGEKDFAEEVLSHCPREKILEFFKTAGLQICRESEEDGRIYPASLQSASVVDALRGYAKRLDVEIRTETAANEIVPCKNGFFVNDQKLWAKKVIVAAGSVAGGHLGRDSYSLLTGLGHEKTDLVPALTPLLCDMKKYKNLKGLRVPARLLLTRNQKPVEKSGGEILFSETGVSGVCAMQLGKAAEKGDELHIDFGPLLDVEKRKHFHEAAFERDLLSGKEKILSCLEERQRILPREYLLTGLLPRALSDIVDPSMKTSLPVLAERLADFTLSVQGKKGMEGAQVVHGGIRTRDFDAETMESRLVPGLYAAGEILNVDGECGGFNLMFAWATGLLAGHGAAAALNR